MLLGCLFCARVDTDFLMLLLVSVWYICINVGVCLCCCLCVSRTKVCVCGGTAEPPPPLLLPHATARSCLTLCRRPLLTVSSSASAALDCEDSVFDYLIDVEIISLLCEINLLNVRRDTISHSSWNINIILEHTGGCILGVDYS